MSDGIRYSLREYIAAQRGTIASVEQLRAVGAFPEETTETQKLFAVIELLGHVCNDLETILAGGTLPSTVVLVKTHGDDD